MAIKNGWDFEASAGFTGSAGKTYVQSYARGGGVKKDCYATGGKIGPVKKGALHKDLGVPQGQKIPASRLQAAKNSSSPLERKRANFAINAKKWQHKAEGGAVTQGAGKKGPDLNVKAPGNHLAYAKGGVMTRPPGMPRAPVVGMKRTRHPPGMPGGIGKPMPGVPGLPAAGAAPMGVPGKPGSAPRVLAKGGKARC